MKDYLHKVQYYETDRMGVVHHSNYIRIMEEARIDYMDQIGVSYESLEEMGYISPVISASCEYKSMSRFGETLSVCTRLEEFKNVRFSLSYVMKDTASNEIRAIGTTTHCFVNPKGSLISLKKENKEIFDLFLTNVSVCS